MGCQTALYFHAFSRYNMPLGLKKRVFQHICLYFHVLGVGGGYILLCCILVAMLTGCLWVLLCCIFSALQLCCVAFWLLC